MELNTILQIVEEVAKRSSLYVYTKSESRLFVSQTEMKDDPVFPSLMLWYDDNGVYRTDFSEKVLFSDPECIDKLINFLRYMCDLAAGVIALMPVEVEVDVWSTFKGNQTMDVGYFYAPYMPILKTPTVTVDPNTFNANKGILTRYGKKLLAQGSAHYSQMPMPIPKPP